MERKIEVMGWLEGLAQDDWMNWHSDSEVQNIAKAALDLLKEQEAIEPLIQTAVLGKDSWWYICGACSRRIDKADAYCRHCGRAVKWET